MRAPVLVQQFTHVVCTSQSLPSLIENSAHFSYLLGKVADKKIILESTRHTGKKRQSENDIRLDGN